MKAEFAICIENKGYDDLEKRKMYRILPDAKADEAGCLRVIDESGEDYLYPADRFISLQFPKEIQERLLNSITAQPAQKHG